MTDDTPSLPPEAPAVSAFDRVQSRPDDENERGGLRPLLVLVLVLVGLAIAWALLGREPADERANLLVHLVDAADAFQADLATTRPVEAEAFVYETLGWSVPPPDLPGLALVGAAVAAIGQVETDAPGGPALDVVVPAFRYEGDSGETVIVFAYDYITLDRTRPTLDLPEAAYSVLAEPTPVDTRRADDAYLVSWRVRAMIFTAVTRSDDVFDRVAQAVAS